MREKIIDIAKEAGEIILRMYRAGGAEYEIKDDNSPVTQADLASSRFLCEALTKQFSIPCVSEEAEVPYDIRKDWREMFVIDPLDGTKDYIARNDGFTVNIALVRDRKPVMGAILIPVTGEMFYAEAGQGAFLLKDGGTEKLPRIRNAQRILARSWLHDPERVEEFARQNGIAESRKMSSATRFPRLAEGVVTVYPGFNRSKEWDTAAGHVILAESGGSILDLATRTEPVYNKPELRNNMFIAGAAGIDLGRLSLPA